MKHNRFITRSQADPVCSFAVHLLHGRKINHGGSLSIPDAYSFDDRLGSEGVVDINELRIGGPIDVVSVDCVREQAPALRVHVEKHEIARIGLKSRNIYASGM